MDPVTLMIFAGAALALMLAAYAVMGAGASARKRMRRRADAIVRRFSGRGEAAAAPRAHSVKRDDRAGDSSVDAMVRRLLPNPAVLSARLARTGRTIRLGSYFAAGAGLGAAVAAVSILGAGLPHLLGGLLGVIAAFGLPHLAVSILIARREKAFVRQFPDAIDLIVRGVKSGLPVTEGIAMVGREMPDPVGGEFRAIADNIRFGMNLEEALWDAARKVDIQEFKFFVISLVVQAETGGNLAETLGNLSTILRQRQQMKLKIKAMASEARASATILGSLPFVMVAILFAVNADYVLFMFNDPRGQMALGLAFLSVMAGIAVMVRMVRFEV